MNPVVVIATDQRQYITCVNIRSLLAQSYPPAIVIVVTDINEAELYRDYPVHVVMNPNAPLGNKWQTGVDYARRLSPSHLIITGSDDILCKNFVKRFCLAVPFVGFQRWYVYDPASGMLYLFDYLARQCLGGGRIYSNNMLDSYEWRIFDKHKRRELDDYGWEITNPDTRHIVRDEGCILSIKGNWPVMNKLSVMLRHKNTELIWSWEGEEAKAIIKEKFGYDTSK